MKSFFHARSFVFSLFIASVFFYFLDIFYWQPHEKKKAILLYEKNLKDSILAEEKNIKESILAGDLNHLFFLESLPEWQLEKFLELHRSIKDMAFIKKNGYVFAKTFSKLPLKKIKKKLKKLKKNRGIRRYIQKNQLLTLFPVMDDKKLIGALLVSWKIIKPFSSPFCGLTNGKNFILIPEDALSQIQKKFLEEKLLKNSYQTTSFTIEADATFGISIKPSALLGFSLFLAQEALPFYAFFSFWLVFFAGFAFLLLWIAEKNFEPISVLLTSKKKEEVEQILQTYQRTLHALKQEQEKIKLPALDEKAFHIEKEIPAEKVAASAPSEAVFEVEEVTTKQQNVIELKPIVREFRFIDPFSDEEMPEETLPPRIEQIRAHALEESRDLLEQIAQPEKEESKYQWTESLQQKLETFREKFKSILVNPILPALNDVYFDEIEDREVKRLLALSANQLKADAASLMLFDLEHGCYYVKAHSGLADSLASNFYFLKQDAIFPVTNQETWFFPGKEHLQNVFFTKRFGLKKNRPKALFFIPLQKFYLDSYLVFFYQKLPDIIYGQDDKKVPPAIYDMVPALRTYIEEKEVASPVSLKNFTESFQKTLIRVTELGARPINVLILQVPALESHQIALLRSILLSILLPEERVILNTPKRILFYLVKTSPEQILETLEGNVEIKGSQVLQYPDNGRSFYIYM
ncbi:MAG: hypothetical protein D6767_06270 [Candidatus Hydrogenedentota bacterium]|nr:MAG: hypothetical protein D6767_06270 [Candidatus Hydrogenedentota bacterium]